MERSAVQFRPVETSEEIAATAALAKEVWAECYAHILKPAQITYMLDTFQSVAAITRQIQTEGYEYFLIEVDGAPAGYIGVQEKDKKLLLSKLYLLARFRGAGAGRRALAFVEALAPQKQCHSVCLTVNRYNKRAIDVYTHAGYQNLRQQNTNIGGGFLMEDFVLEKPLSPATPAK